MITLALDQSSRTSGFSVWNDNQLVEYGHFTLDKDDIGERLNDFIQKLHEFTLTYKPNKIVFEEIQMQNTVGNNVVTFKTLAYIQAVIIVYCQQQNIPYQIVPSVTWKSYCGIQGKKRDEQKRNAQQFVLNKFEKTATQDESDAICIGFYATKNSLA